MHSVLSLAFEMDEQHQGLHSYFSRHSERTEKAGKGHETNIFIQVWKTLLEAKHREREDQADRERDGQTSRMKVKGQRQRLGRTERGKRRTKNTKDGKKTEMKT